MKRFVLLLTALITFVCTGEYLCGQNRVVPITTDSIEQTAPCVVHIGDSHLQAGYLSQEIRQLLQKEWGNGGLGLATPYRIMGTNSPTCYTITSGGGWVKNQLSVRQSVPQVSVGGGLIIRRDRHPFIISIKSSLWHFDRLLIFRSAKAPSLYPSLQSGVLKKGTDIVNGLVVDTLQLGHQQEFIALKSERTPSRGDAYGDFLLLNGQKGLLYHQIGLNGAMYATYAQHPFLQQLVRLHPTLIVVSLGSNEAQARQVDSLAFKSQVRSFVRQLRKLMPQVKILLTSPPPNFTRKRGWNSQVEVIAASLAQVAEEESLYFYDLYSAIGDRERAEELRKGGDYYAYDGVHFTKEAYRQQGRLLGEVIRDVLKQLENTPTEEYDGLHKQP